MLFPERPITLDLLRAFCAKFNEGYRVEYKRTLDANVRDKLPKVLSSFANSNGGVLVVGVNTQNGVPQPPFDGFKASPREEFPLTIENICLQNIYPPIFPRTTVVASDVSDHTFIIIEVEESAQAPHAIENSKNVYIRTGSATNPYELADVDLLFDLAKRRKQPLELRAKLIDRAKKRFRTHLRLNTVSKTGQPIKLGTLIQCSIGPTFPSRQLCRQEDLADRVRKSWTSWRGLMFPDAGSAILSQEDSAIVLDAMKGTSYFEINAWGMLFFGANFHTELADKTVVNLNAFLGYVFLFLTYSGKLLKTLGYPGTIEIDLFLDPILGLEWVHHWAGYPIAAAKSELDDEIALTFRTTADSLSDEPSKISVEVFQNVFFSVGTPALVDTPEKLKGLVRQACVYNSWDVPVGF